MVCREVSNSEVYSLKIVVCDATEGLCEAVHENYILFKYLVPLFVGISAENPQPTATHSPFCGTFCSLFFFESMSYFGKISKCV